MRCIALSERQQEVIMNKKRISVETLTLTALLTALVIVLQFAGAFIRFGLFQVSLVLVPIVIGAATCGAFSGAWLGFVFGMVVLLNGDAAAFLTISPGGTVLTVLLKGTLCGLFSGLVYKAFEKRNRILAVIAAAIVCPVVNSGVFLLGCFTFFYDTILSWASASEYSESITQYFIFGLGLINFPIELAINIVLSPIIVRLLDIRNKIKVR